MVIPIHYNCNFSVSATKYIAHIVHTVVFHSNVSCMTSDQTEISITEQLYCYCCWHRHVDTLSAVKEREGAFWQLGCMRKKNLLDVESAQHKELANYFWNGKGVFEMWECFLGYIPQTANKWQAHKQDVERWLFPLFVSPNTRKHTHTQWRENCFLYQNYWLQSSDRLVKAFTVCA